MVHLLLLASCEGQNASFSHECFQIPWISSSFKKARCETGKTKRDFWKYTQVAQTRVNVSIATKACANEPYIFYISSFPLSDLLDLRFSFHGFERLKKLNNFSVNVHHRKNSKKASIQPQVVNCYQPFLQIKKVSKCKRMEGTSNLQYYMCVEKKKKTLISLSLINKKCSFRSNKINCGILY